MLFLLTPNRSGEYGELRIVPTDPSAFSGRLPNGRHFVPREVVEHNQRERLLAAAAVAVSEHGYAKLSVRQVVKQAGVSSRTFYEFFGNKQEVLLAAYDASFDRLLGAIETACAGVDGWPARVRAGTAAALHFAVTEPEAASLVGVHTLASGPEGAKRVLDSRARLATLLAPGRHHGALAAQLPELTERALVDAIWMLVGSRLVEGASVRLGELEPQLIELALIPYLGCEGAAREETGPS